MGMASTAEIRLCEPSARMSVWTRCALVAVLSCGCAAKAPVQHDAIAEHTAPGAIIPADGGEHRILRGRKPITLKVDPLSVGSEHLFLGTEIMPPGDSIPLHRHLEEEEILLVQRGSLMIHLGDRVERAGTGATVFVPRGVWIGLMNISADTAAIVYIFNEPSFSRCLRAFSSPPGVGYVEPSADSVAQIRHDCHQGVPGH